MEKNRIMEVIKNSGVPPKFHDRLLDEIEKMGQACRRDIEESTIKLFIKNIIEKRPFDARTP